MIKIEVVWVYEKEDGSKAYKAVVYDREGHVLHSIEGSRQLVVDEKRTHESFGDTVQIVMNLAEEDPGPHFGHFAIQQTQRTAKANP